MIVNVGLLIFPEAPSPRHTPCTKQVFPLPRVPCNATIAPDSDEDDLEMID